MSEISRVIYNIERKVNIRLIRDKGNESLSALINDLLAKWLNEQE